MTAPSEEQSQKLSFSEPYNALRATGHTRRCRPPAVGSDDLVAGLGGEFDDASVHIYGTTVGNADGADTGVPGVH